MVQYKKAFQKPSGSGTIIVNPLRAKLDVDMSEFGQQSPYCVVKLEEKSKKTRPHNGGGQNEREQETQVKYHYID